MEELTRQVRRAQRRLGLQRFVAALGWCLSVALVLALVGIVVGKFWPLGLASWHWGVGGAALGVLAAIVWSVARGGGSLDAAVELDRRFGLKERVSSSLALSPEERDSEIGQALVEDAIHKVSRIDVGEHFRVAPNRQLLMPLVPAIAVLVVAMVVNPAAVQNPAKANTTTEAAKKQVKTSSENLRKKLAKQQKQAEKEGLKDAKDLLTALQRGADELATKAPADRKDALAKLNNLSREVQKRREMLGGAKQVQEQFRQLKDISRGPADRFADAVARGDFKKALDELKKLQNEVANGKLTDQQRKDLAKQMEQMKEKLQKLANAHRQAEQDLQKQIEQAKQMGQQGEAERLQQQLNQLRQQQPQMQQLQNMAQKLGQCAQCMKDGQMKEAGEAMAEMQNEMANLQEQLKELEMLNEAEDDLKMARDQMVCPNCQGMGCEACQGDKPGRGLGAGRGVGERPKKDSDGQFYNTSTKQKVGKGMADVTGEVSGPNIKGNVQTQIQEQVEAARQEEADPLSNQRMPRTYREHATEYFNRFREGK